MLDTEISTWSKLLGEFEDEGHSDLNINGHDHQKRGGIEGGIPRNCQVSYGLPQKISNFIMTHPPDSLKFNSIFNCSLPVSGEESWEISPRASQAKYAFQISLLQDALLYYNRLLPCRSSTVGQLPHH